MKRKVLKIVELAKDRKAVDITALDLRKVANFCDFFVIITGTSATHIKSIADGINEGLRKDGLGKHHAEGYQESKWVVLDYFSVIVHIFDEETRFFYDLEYLWSDAPKLKLNKKVN
ncbi:MAG: ribosome silencing factor [Candidatus Omnitrophica bacterium]|nr:ribosome silencing factor [Candidatus Omnitrophota bacterium]